MEHDRLPIPDSAMESALLHAQTECSDFTGSTRDDAMLNDLDSYVALSQKPYEGA